MRNGGTISRLLTMRVSVVVPVFNHERYVSECLRSIDQQHCDDLEIIVIDDGSTDDSWKRIDAFVSSARRAVVKLRTPNRGAHAAINEGLARATGDWLTLCNSDDIFLPGRLATLADTVRAQPACELAFTGVRYLDPSSRDVSESDRYARDLRSKQNAISEFPSVGFALTLTNVAISTGNFFFSRALWREAGDFRPYKLCHDWDFILRCLLLTEPVFVPAPLYGYRLHAANSFSSLMSTAAAVECPELMRRFLCAACTRPTRNRLCPSPRNWPQLFEAFIAEHRYEPYMAAWDSVDEPVYRAHVDAPRQRV
jgi:glycosyltransferase involved in cell wall biosynthesis